MGLCENCVSVCLSCVNAENCLECKPGLKLEKGICKCKNNGING
jgi:hypothetical protein